MASPHLREAIQGPVIPNTTQPSVKIEAFEFHQDGSSEYRILVDSRRTKYVSLAAAAIPSKNLINFSCSPLIGIAPVLPLPPGDWNHGVVTKCPLTNKPVWTTALNDWPGVSSLWHDVTIDTSEFTSVMAIRNNLQIIQCPYYPGSDLLFKFAAFPYRVPAINHETLIYKAITEKRAETEDDHGGMW